MKNYLSLCIWENGPGRPYDNIYLLKEITFVNDNTLHLKFQNDEECIINNPQDIILSEKKITIQNASKILWTFYEYGKLKSKNALVRIEYIKVNNSHIRIIENGIFARDEKISAKTIAFDSYGNIDKEFIEGNAVLLKK